MGPPQRRDDRDRAERRSSRARLVASLPLLVVSGGLLASAALTLRLSPHSGPDGFPLWGLLLTLGAIAGIGAVASWFGAIGPEPGPSPDRRGVGEPMADAGRPAPQVRRDRSAAHPLEEDWDETAIPVRAPGRAVRARARPTSPEPDEVERALIEIENIEAELATRPRPERRPGSAPARS